jgi:hypothetical protein
MRQRRAINASCFFQEIYDVDHQARHTRQLGHCATSVPFSLSPPVPDRQRWDCRCRKPAGSDYGSNF